MIEPSGTVASTPELEGVSAFFVMVGPALAESLLESYEIDYRKFREKYGDGLARDMTNGNWLFDGSPIRIDNDDKLFDGQHRLKAVVKSGIPTIFLFVVGLPSEAYNTTDTGLARTWPDSLRRRGYTNVTGRSALVKVIDRWLGMKHLDLPERLTNTELDLVHDAHVDSVNRAMQLSVGTVSKVDIPAALVSFLWWLLPQIDTEKAHIFMTQVIYGENIKRGDPAYTLRSRLYDERDSDLNRHTYLNLVFQAWNAFYAGVPITRLLQGDGSRSKMTMPDGYDIKDEIN